VYKVDLTLSTSNFAASEFASDGFGSTATSGAWFTNATVGGFWTNLTSKQIDGGLFPDQCTASPLVQGLAQTYSKRFNGGAVSAYRYSTDPCVDGCSEYSRARVVVSTLGALVSQIRNDPATTADLSARISLLASSLQTLGEGYTNLVYARSSTGDFVAVEWCFQADASSYCRLSSTQFVAYASSFGAFGDKKLRVLALSDAFITRYASPVFTSTSDFNVTADFAYFKNGSTLIPSQRLNGFSDSFPMPSGRTGRVFQKQVYMDSTPFAEVGAAETSSRSPCFNTCQGNSFAATAARATSAITVTNLTTIPTGSDRSFVANTLSKVMAAFVANAGDNYMLELLVANGDYYAVTSCSAVENIYNAWCRQAGIFNDYIAYLRVENVFGPSLQVFKVRLFCVWVQRSAPSALRCIDSLFCRSPAAASLEIN
jgi:hypothetical protein